MYEEEIDFDEHWSYTIMGNWRADHYFEDLFFICLESETDEEKKQVRPENEFLDSMKILIGRCHDKLITFARRQHSRLAYLVLGWFLMFFGGEFTEEIKEQILKYSEWKYEKLQFKTEEEKELRKKYLSEFREKIVNYIEGTPTLISEETLSDIYYNNGPWDLTPIKYDLRKM
jgi:hypothetical protein